MTFLSLHLWGYMPRPSRDKAKRKYLVFKIGPSQPCWKDLEGRWSIHEIFIFLFSWPVLATVTKSVLRLQCRFSLSPCLHVSSESLVFLSSTPSCYCAVAASREKPQQQPLVCAARLVRQLLPRWLHMVSLCSASSLREKADRTGAPQTASLARPILGH